jgi:hypothetical protein
MADPAMRDEVVAADFNFVTWRRAPTGDAADPADFSDMNDWIRKAIFEPAAAYAADVRDEIGRAPTDAVVSIDLLFGAVGLARRRPALPSPCCRHMSVFGRCRARRRPARV